MLTRVVARRCLATSPRRIDGWAQSVQKSGQFVFVKIGDGTQIVVDKKLAESVQVGSSISAWGKWQKSQGEQQEMELIADTFQVLGKDSNPRYNISADNLRKKMHLRARSDEFAAILRARSRVFRATHDFFMDRGFVNVDTPKFTQNDCEGGGEVFEVQDENSTKMFLSVSSQLHLEAMTSRLEKVYTLGPAFRAEKQQSHAHLSEFYMLEAEVAFTETVDEMCDLVQNYVQSLISMSFENVDLKTDIDRIGTFRNPEDRLESSKLLSRWPRIKYTEALRILAENGQNVADGRHGFSKQNELALVAIHGSPVFVTHYPIEQKPFYMARDSESNTTLSFDLLCPVVGELAGGSVRERDVEELKKRGCSIDWYLELRKRGQPPTAGFGIGFERLLQFLFSVRNIKDVIPFPRWYKHCQC